MVKAIQIKVLASGQIQIWNIAESNDYIINPKYFWYEFKDWQEYFDIFTPLNVPMHVISPSKPL